MYYFSQNKTLEKILCSWAGGRHANLTAWILFWSTMAFLDRMATI